MFKLESLLLEQVYGANAIVYHRTSIENLVELISKNGYKFGVGDTYGEGLYATYDLESQLNFRMFNLYGKYIVKISVKVQDFLILDWDVFEKHPDFSSYDGADYFNFIDLQIERYSIPIEYHIHPYDYTSITATSILKNIGKHNIQNFVNGMIFTGESDGRVMVIYHPERVAVPLSVSNDDGQTFVKVIEIKNSKRFRNILRNRNIKHDFSREVYLDLTLSTFDVKDGKFIKDYSNEKVLNFYADYLGLTTLKGSPKVVLMNFDCSQNKLVTLEGAPIKVGGDFKCRDNKLKTLEGSPVEVGGSFWCDKNELISLKGAPKEVGGNFYISDNARIFTEEEVRAVCDVKGKVYVI